MDKRRTAGALAALGALGLGIGGTYAAISDTEQGPNTLVHAETLDLRLSTEEDASIEPILFEGIQPGDQRSYVVRLTNDGTISGSASWAFENIQEFENGCNPPELAAESPTCETDELAGELGDQLSVTISSLPAALPQAGCTGTPSVLSPRNFPSSSSLLTSSGSLRFRNLGLSLDPNESRCIRVDVLFEDLPENNMAQSDSSSFGFRFRLVS